MSENEYHKLAGLLPPFEDKMKRREQQLKKWAKEEFLYSLKKLSEWEKQLIINSKHQDDVMGKIDNYGQLLFILGEFRRGSIYWSRILKRIQRDKVVEGHHWRKNLCLIQKQLISRTLIYRCYYQIGRWDESFQHMQKLLRLYEDIRIEQSDSDYLKLLFKMYRVTPQLGKLQEYNKYRKDIIRICHQNQLTDASEYKSIMQHEKKSNKLQAKKKLKKEEEKQMIAKEKESVKQLKQELKKIRMQTYGKFSPVYLNKLSFLIYKLFELKSWQQVKSFSKIYFNIREIMPQMEDRQISFVILHKIFLCGKMGKDFPYFCQYLIKFIPVCFYTTNEFDLAIIYMQQCFKLSEWRLGKLIIIQLMKAQIKCKIFEKKRFFLLLYGYGILLLTASTQQISHKFLLWMKKICHQQEWENELTNKFLDYFIEYNEKYRKRENGLLDERRKDYLDSHFLTALKQQIKLPIFKYYSPKWEPCEAELIIFECPLYLLPRNYIYTDIDNHLARSNLTMFFLSIQKVLEFHFHSISPTLKYVRKLRTVVKLHLNDQHIKAIPSLLYFYQSSFLEVQVELKKIGIDVWEAIKRTQHLRDDWREILRKELAFIHEKLSDKNIKHHLNMNKQEVIKIKSIYEKYKHYLSNTRNRRLKANHQ